MAPVLLLLFLSTSGCIASFPEFAQYGMRCSMTITSWSFSTHRQNIRPQNRNSSPTSWMEYSASGWNFQKLIFLAIYQLHLPTQANQLQRNSFCGPTAKLYAMRFTSFHTLQKLIAKIAGQKPRWFVFQNIESLLSNRLSILIFK